MSYELDYHEKKPCPCGNGTIVIDSFSNEWGKNRQNVHLVCPYCRIEYEVSQSGRHKNGLYETYPVLVSRVPEPAPRSPGINIYTTPLEEQYCLVYSYDALVRIGNALAKASSYSALIDEDAKKIVRMCKASCNTQRITFVREKVATALKMYGEYPCSHDNMQKLKAEYNAKWPRKVIRI